MKIYELMIGYSYFMKIENDDDLAFVKERKIKPLLEEYFYADDENYKKAIGVLNKEFDILELSDE